LQLPSATDFSAAALQELRTNSFEKRDITDQVLKCIEVRKPTLKYRRGTLLVFRGNTNAAPVARVAISSGIDDMYSSAFLANGFPEMLGVDKSFYRRAGTQVVDQRVRKIGIGAAADISYGDLLQRRSALRLNIEVLEKSESPDEKLLEKIAARKSSLAQIEAELDKVPFRAMQPFEMCQQLDDMLANSKRRLTITTSMPHPTKCGSMTFMLLEQALRRDMQVEIFVVGRPEPDFLVIKSERWRALKRLSELAANNANLRVGFLKEPSRTIFEVRADDSKLVISNEPPLGIRPTFELARNFTGYAISGRPQVEAYSQEYLNEEALTVVQDFRYQKHQESLANAKMRKAAPRIKRGKK
jgi:hypothetical protein